MRKIYIDKNYQCFVTEGDGRIAVDCPYFYGKCDEFIEGYRFIPEGESWTRDDGVEFHGMSISPLVSYKELDDAQRKNEHEALEHIGILGEDSPVAQAMEMRDAINSVVSSMDDEIAMSTPLLFPAWSADGIHYKIGDRVRQNNDLYKCIQKHTSQSDWTPEAAVSLWVKIADPANEWPDWVQPLGGHDAYSKGNKVSYKGKRYISTADGNVWAPGVYGWEVAAS